MAGPDTDPIRGHDSFVTLLSMNLMAGPDRNPIRGHDPFVTLSSTYLMAGPDPDLALRGRQPLGFRVVPEHTEKSVRVWQEVLGFEDVRVMRDCALLSVKTNQTKVNS